MQLSDTMLGWLRGLTSAERHRLLTEKCEPVSTGRCILMVAGGIDRDWKGRVEHGVESMHYVGNEWPYYWCGNKAAVSQIWMEYDELVRDGRLSELMAAVREELLTVEAAQFEAPREAVLA